MKTKKRKKNWKNRGGGGGGDEVSLVPQRSDSPASCGTRSPPQDRQCQVKDKEVRPCCPFYSKVSMPRERDCKTESNQETVNMEIRIVKRS